MRTQIPGQEKNVCSAVPGSAFWCEQPSSSWNARWLLVLPVGLQYAQTKTLLLLLKVIKYKKYKECSQCFNANKCYC